MPTKPDHPPCNLVKGLSTLFSFILIIIGFYVSFQEGRIRQLETKNDAIVRMQRDLEYQSDNIKELRADMKLLLKRSPDAMIYSVMDEKISCN